MATCIQTGIIVWSNGPFPCGSHPDLRTARASIVCQLDTTSGEMTLADGGHNDNCEFFETATGANDADQRMKSVARAHHETVNRGSKALRILGKKFQHKLNKHSVAFNACLNTIQMALECQWELGDDGECKDGLFKIDHWTIVECSGVSGCNHLSSCQFSVRFFSFKASIEARAAFSTRIRG